MEKKFKAIVYVDARDELEAREIIRSGHEDKMCIDDVIKCVEEEQ